MVGQPISLSLPTRVEVELGCGNCFGFTMNTECLAKVVDNPMETIGQSSGMSGNGKYRFI